MPSPGLAVSTSELRDFNSRKARLWSAASDPPIGSPCPEQILQESHSWVLMCATLAEIFCRLWPWFTLFIPCRVYYRARPEWTASAGGG
jgi:hypothetical protein